MPVPRIALTSGEPAGVGPELCLAVAARDWPAEVVILGDRGLLEERARGARLRLDFSDYVPGREATAQRAGRVLVAHHALAAPCVAGRLDAANARFVLGMLDRALDGCASGEFAAMVTAPVQKSVINDAGVPFSGHTEYLAERTATPLPVMLLVAGTLRVALATTHLPLASVPAAITRAGLEAVITVLDEGLRRRFRLRAPRIAVCGLNPHAGESGHLGHEEQDVISPAIAACRGRGINAQGPVPADTAFTPAALERADAVLAMYHDQGLPVLKHAGFDRGVNVTLGLPIVRTSVDHGTALDLAGTGRADPGSLLAAVGLALSLATA